MLVVSMRGELSSSWKGDDIGYHAMHIRLNGVRGSAKNLDCLDCGRPAMEWSYNHTGDNEKTGLNGGRVVYYSMNIDDYEPRCIPCHRLFDRRLVAQP